LPFKVHLQGRGTETWKNIMSNNRGSVRQSVKHQKAYQKVGSPGHSWLMPVILTAWEAEIGRILVWGQPSSKTFLFQWKKAGHGGTSVIPVTVGSFAQASLGISRTYLGIWVPTIFLIEIGTLSPCKPLIQTQYCKRKEGRKDGSGVIFIMMVHVTISSRHEILWPGTAKWKKQFHNSNNSNPCSKQYCKIITYFGEKSQF
jgi:hypothetical protein